MLKRQKQSRTKITARVFLLAFARKPKLTYSTSQMLWFDLDAQQKPNRIWHGCRALVWLSPLGRRRLPWVVIDLGFAYDTQQKKNLKLKKKKSSSNSIFWGLHVPYPSISSIFVTRVTNNNANPDCGLLCFADAITMCCECQVRYRRQHTSRLFGGWRWNVTWQ